MRDITVRPSVTQQSGSRDAEARRLAERELDAVRGGKGKGGDCYGYGCGYGYGYGGGYGAFYGGWGYGGYGWY